MEALEMQLVLISFQLTIIVIAILYGGKNDQAMDRLPLRADHRRT